MSSARNGTGLPLTNDKPSLPIRPVMSIRIGHPKLLTLHTLWRSRCAEGLPARRDFDVMELGPWMGNLQLLEVLDDGKAFRYRLQGVHLVELVGKDQIGSASGRERVLKFVEIEGNEEPYKKN